MTEVFVRKVLNSVLRVLKKKKSEILAIKLVMKIKTWIFTEMPARKEMYFFKSSTIRKLTLVYY